MAKKLTSKEQLEKQYKQQLRRINRWIKAREEEGVFLRPKALPEQPKRITDASVRRLKELTSEKLWKKAVTINTDTGELIRATPKQYITLHKGKISKPSSETPSLYISKNPKTRQPLTEEQRKAMSERMKKYWTEHPLTEEQRRARGERLRKYWAEHPLTDEQKRQRAERLRQYWAEHPREKKVKQKSPRKGHPMSEENKRKASERMKKYWQEKKGQAKSETAEQTKSPSEREKFGKETGTKMSSEDMTKSDTIGTNLDSIYDMISRAEQSWREDHVLKAKNARSLLDNQIEHEGRDAFVLRVSLVMQDLYTACQGYIYESNQEVVEACYNDMVFIIYQYAQDNYFKGININATNKSVSTEYYDLSELESIIEPAFNIPDTKVKAMKLLSYLNLEIQQEGYDAFVLRTKASKDILFDAIKDYLYGGDESEQSLQTIESIVSGNMG